MPILQITTTQMGQEGVNPKIIYIDTNDTLATVLTAGYLNNVANEQHIPLSQKDLALVTTKPSAGSSTTNTAWLSVSYTVSTGAWSLVPASNPGDVTLPTIANHIATFTNALGMISEDPATAISGGNIQAGLSGTAGYLSSFPATAAKGSLRLVAVANTGDTLVTLSNALHGQASVYSIPDCANAVGRLLVGATATPLVSGNFPQNSGTAGLVVDSGLAVSNIQNKTNIKAAAASLAGGSTSATITVAGMTSSSVVVATFSTQTNAAYVIKAIPGSGNFVATFNADPGSSTLNYVAFIAAQ